jgi:hypothetical protein
MKKECSQFATINVTTYIPHKNLSPFPAEIRSEPANKAQKDILQTNFTPKISSLKKNFVTKLKRVIIHIGSDPRT